MAPRRVVSAILGALSLALAGGCASDGHAALSAPPAILSDVLYVEIDRIALERGILEVAGSVANLTGETVTLDPSTWRLASAREEHRAEADGLVFEIPRGAVAYVRWRFPVSVAPRRAALIVGPLEGARSPRDLGSIPLLTDGGLPEHAPRSAPDDRREPKAQDILERDCGSGPLVTCPR